MPSRFLLKATLPPLVVPNVVRVIVGLLRTTGDLKVILPPLPATLKVSILSLRIVFFVPELRVTFPPVPVTLELESRTPVVMLPSAVERAIAPPFPPPEELTSLL